MSVKQGACGLAIHASWRETAPVMKAALRLLLPALLAAVPPIHATDLYSIGQPTDDEQHYLELINRARADPTAEGQRLATSTDPEVLSAIAFFNVNLTVMQNEFAALPVRPPLVFNAKLIQAARGHSQDMFDNVFQGHTGSGGSSAVQRMLAAGYASNGSAENVFSFVKSTFQGHAGFQIDWGADEDGTDNGMQSKRGHRMNIHIDLREVGIGVVLGTKTSGGTTVGPQLVTQNFANPSVNNQAFVTGVAYYDLNGNSFYDPGEGIGGLTVNVAGSSFHAVTANSGGYAVPVPTSNASRAVTFSGLGLNGGGDAVISGGGNVKLDFTPAYSPPVLSGPAEIPLGQLSSHNFTPVGGATSHELRVVPDIPVPADGAENLARVTPSTTGAYTPLSTAVKHAGAAAYRLTHPALAISTESLTYDGTYLVQSGGALSFRSRLRLATGDQIARVLVSTDNGLSWQPVYTQAGTGGAGEGSFQLRNVSLVAFEGKEIRLRFDYVFAGGSVFTGTQDDRGWFIDEITFTNLRDVTTGAQIFPIAGGETEATFTPSSLGNFLLAVRPVISDRDWPFGPAFQATVVENLALNLAVRRNGLDLANGGAAVQAGNVTPGQSAQVTITLHNTGTSEDLTGISAQITGAAYSLHTAPAATLAPGAQTSLIVEFTPPAEGAHNGSVQIASNDPDSNPFVVNLTGSGVIPPPEIHDHPESQLAQLGGNASFTVNATGIGITRQWLKNGKAIPGETGDTLNLLNVKSSDAALYSARVTAGGQSLTSNTARLGVITSPPALVQVKEGGSAALACAVAAPKGAALGFQWQKDDVNLGPADKPKGFNTAKLAIAKADQADAAGYHCLVSMTLPAAEGGATLMGQSTVSQLAVVLKPVIADPGFGADFVSESVDGKYTLSAANGATKFTASGLPSGVKLNPATGELTGKPLAAKLDKLGNPLPYQVKLGAANLAGAGPVIIVPWTIQPLPSAMHGRFELLVDRDAPINSNLGGHITLLLTSGGKASGALLQQGKKYSLTGQIEVAPGGGDASLSATVKRPRGMGDLVLNLPGMTAPDALTGTLEETGAGAASAGVNGWRCPFDAKNKTTLAGVYNLALPAPPGGDSALAPGGHSFASVSLSTAGAAKWAGVLADGATFTAAHLLGLPSGAEAARLLLHAPLYKGTGSVLGSVKVNDLPGAWETDAAGLDWLKLAQLKPMRSYTDGFGPLALEAEGARFLKPQSGQLLTGLAAAMNLKARSGGLGAHEFECGATLSGKHAVTLGPVTGPPGSTQISGLKVTITAAKGRISGGFTLIEDAGTPQQTKRAVKLAGIVVPVAGGGAAGHFQLPENPAPGQKANSTPIQSGSIVLEE